MAKSISHHARFRSTMISGGGRLRPQEDSLNQPIDMVVGTPGRLLKHIEDGNMVYGDIKYLVKKKIIILIRDIISLFTIVNRPIVSLSSIFTFLFVYSIL